MAKIETSPDLIPLEALTQAAECFKVLAHPVRLRIVDILMQGDYPVGEIAHMCAVQPNQASEHLRLMQVQGLLKSERRGRTVYYKIDSPRVPSLLRCIRQHCHS